MSFFNDKKVQDFVSLGANGRTWGLGIGGFGLRNAFLKRSRKSEVRSRNWSMVNGHWGLGIGTWDLGLGGFGLRDYMVNSNWSMGESGCDTFAG